MTLAVGRLHGVSTEEMFRLAVDACPSGMIMTDRSGAIVMLNTEIELLFGYSRDELIGLPIEIRAPRASRRQHFGLRAGFAQNPRTRRIAGESHRSFRRSRGCSRRVFDQWPNLHPHHVKNDFPRFDLFRYRKYR